MKITTNKTIVTSFRARKDNWKKLKIVSAIEGVPIQDKLNDIIENYVNTNYGQLLNQNVSEDDNGTKEKLSV
tara:strand:+ start:364 stop:579 length:216 start_codon:yes stop_codon:yes gene_type:complete